MTGNACCARAAIGHAAAPPRTLRKLRRLMGRPQSRGGKLPHRYAMRTPLCVTAKLAAKCSDGSIASDHHARDIRPNVRFGPKATVRPSPGLKSSQTRDQRHGMRKVVFALVTVVVTCATD